MALISSIDIQFVINLVLSVVIGFLIGAERESRGKDAGISTHTLVIAGSMLFTYLSSFVDPASKSRLAAQIITGVGFLGAGMILKDSGKGKHIRNLTTAASVWFSAGIGMAIGYNQYFIAMVAGIVCLFEPRLPHIDAIRLFKPGNKK
jgi:putative Mg2+ transporter-C (MgtC) family protein